MSQAGSVHSQQSLSGVTVTFAGSGDAFGSGGRFQACIHLRLAGPTGTGQRLTAAMECMFPGATRVRRRFAVEVTELQPGDSAVVAGVRARAFLASHPSGAPALILRLTLSGRVIAYSALG